MGNPAISLLRLRIRLQAGLILDVGATVLLGKAAK
jgi:hypothetical protein